MFCTIIINPELLPVRDDLPADYYLNREAYYLELFVRRTYLATHVDADLARARARRDGATHGPSD